MNVVYVNVTSEMLDRITSFIAMEVDYISSLVTNKHEFVALHPSTELSETQRLCWNCQL